MALAERPEKSDMPPISLLGTPIKLSRVALGTWAIGGWMWGGSDDAESISTIQSAFDHGVTVIDTAPVYGFGHSEELVGRALAEAGMRDLMIIATKAGLDWRDGKPFRDASRKRIMNELEGSLKRLKTDYIDIYQVHWPDPLTPIAETADAMRTLFERGIIRAIGVSNFSVDQMEQFRRVSPLHVVQAPYNLFEREIDADVLPYCIGNKIAILGYGALCRGLLTGRIGPDTVFSDDDLRRVDPKFLSPRFAHYLSAVHKLDALAQRRLGKRVIHLAVRWMLDRGVATALWGARRPDQLDPVGELSGWALDEDIDAEIDQILKEEILSPVGPEFMAPPVRRLGRELV